jgi:hypothetical protein
MDMRKFSAGVVMPEHLHDGPRVETIVKISEHPKHGCAVLEFESGDQLYLWSNLARVLYKAWGHNSEDYLGQEVELSLGQYLDKKFDPPEPKETINIRAVSPAKPGANGSAALRPLPPSKVTTSIKDDLDDSSPF